MSEEHRAKLQSHLAKHNSSEEQRAAARERMLEINKGKRISVEVTDLETNVTKIYDSIIKASKAIGCTGGAITLSKKRSLGKGINRPIKKRYLVKVMRM